MNPLRLAALDASPFCFAKRGGHPPHTRCARARPLTLKRRGQRFLASLGMTTVALGMTRRVLRSDGGVGSDVGSAFVELGGGALRLGTG